MYESSGLIITRFERPRKIILTDVKPVIKGKFEKICVAKKVLGVRIVLRFTQNTITQPVVFECQEDYFLQTLGISLAEHIIKRFYYSANQALKERMLGNSRYVKLPKTVPVLEFSPGNMNNAFGG